MFFGQYTRINSYFEGTELASSGLPQGAELAILETVRSGVPPELFTKPYTNPVGGSPEGGARKSSRGAALAEGSRLRGARPQAGRQQDRSAVRARTARRRPDLRTGHAVLQAVAGAAWHRRQRAHHRSDAVRKPASQLGFRRGRLVMGRSRCRPETNSANTGARRRRTWRVRAISSASRIRRSTS